MNFVCVSSLLVMSSIAVSAPSVAKGKTLTFCAWKGEVDLVTQRRQDRTVAAGSYRHD